MAKNIRVHELAKELGMTNARCFTTLMSHIVANRVSGGQVLENVARTLSIWSSLRSYACAKLESLADAAAWMASSRNESSLEAVVRDIVKFVTGR